jgi:outer membrane protein
MKKNIITALMGAGLVFTAFTGISQAKDSNVGFVDTQKIFQSSKLAEALTSAQNDVKVRESEFSKETLDKSKALEDARAKKVTDTELKKMQDGFQKELEAKRAKLEELKDSKQKELEEMSKKLKVQVEDTIKAVAKEKQIDIVVDKQAVLFGGTDLTEDVIKKMK